MNAIDGGINIIASHSISAYRDVADHLIVLNNGMVKKITSAR